MPDNKLTVSVPDELKQEAKIKAIKKKKSQSRVVRELLRRWIAENGDEEGEG